MNGSGDRISFGPFTLIPSQQLLLKTDQPVQIGTRAFEILTYLVERAGEIVSKEDLIARVWPNVFVQEGNLKVHVATLRQALSDGENGTRYVINVPGRGYRFVAAVSHQNTLSTLSPPGSITTCAHSLPAPLTRMFGRADIVASIANQIPQHRFVSIVGPGGIGKTTIALAIANHLAASYRDGCRFLDLAPLSDPTLLPSALAILLGIGARSDNLIQNLLLYLQDKEVLIVLDSCEHVIDAAATFAEQLLRGARGVHVLTTSREPLRAAGEVVKRPPPLDTPPLDLEAITARDALKYSAIELFVECAAARLDGFALTDEDAPLVAGICQTLDGNALAIELASGRVDAFGVSGVAARLSDRFQLLTGGRRSALPRHQTLVATLDWSYDLLPNVERAVLRRLSVFAGYFNWDAALAVVSDSSISPSDVAAAIANLIAKSLVSAEVSGRMAHYRLLDSTSAYTRNKLKEAAEFEAVALRHATYFRDLFDRAEVEALNQSATLWRSKYAGHLDNVRAALDWAFAPNGDALMGVALTISALTLYLNLSLMDECRQRVKRALLFLDFSNSSTARQEMRLVTALGVALYSIGPGLDSQEAWSRVTEIAEYLGDTDYQLRAYWGLWTVCVTGAKHRDGLALAQTFMRLAQEAEDPEGVLVGERLVGISHHFLGEQTAARRHLEDMLNHAGPLGKPADILRFQFDQSVASRAFLGKILWLQGFADAAMQQISRSVDDARSIGHSLSLCYALGQGACPTALLVGDLAAAEQYIALLRDHSARHQLALWSTMGRCFEGILAIRRGKYPTGVPLLQNAVDELRAAGYSLYFVASSSELADALGRIGQVDAGLSAIEEALAQSIQNDEGWCRAELLRVKAELLLLDSSPTVKASAEDHFQQSLDWARSCEAPAWELRTATSLCRLRSARNGSVEARDLLASIYARFSEGFHTADLLAAKLLIHR